MSDDERRKRGFEMFKTVYDGVVPVPPPELQDDSFFLTIDHLFGEVWSRDVLSVRDRRLMAIGAIAALGEDFTFEVQLRTALKHGEMNAAQLKEVVLFLAYYVGQPRMARLRGVVAKVLKEEGAA